MENIFRKPHIKGFLPYAFAASLVGIVGGFTAVLGPAFVKDLNLPYNNSTWTALAMAMSSATFAPVLGKLGDMIGRRITLLIGISVFLKSVFLASQKVSEYMAKQGGGSIINISSVGGLVPDVSQVAYGTSKAAINYLTKLIAVHEAKNNIRCNAVLPGMTATDAVQEKLSEEFKALFLKHILFERMGKPEEIAAAAVYFASDESAYTTGQILTVSGGFGLATPLYGDLSGKKHRR